MNITCYECGQAGHIWTNFPRLTKVRTVAIRADSTEAPEMDPQEEDEVLPPDKEGEGDNSEYQEDNLMYTWSHSINGILRKKRKQMIMLFPIEPTQSGLRWIQKRKRQPE